MNKINTVVVSCILATTLLAFFSVIASSEPVLRDQLRSKQSMSKEMGLLEQKMMEYGFSETGLNGFRSMLK